MARKAIIHKNTNRTTSNGGILSPKLPDVGTLLKGEIAVNYKNGYETLSIENDAGEIVPFASLELIIAYTDTTISNKKYAGSTSDGGTANKAASIPFGSVDSTSTATAFTATVDGITELRDGVSLYLKNTVVTSAAATDAPKCWTLNINNLGAKPVYVTTAASTYSTTHFTKNYKMLFTYDESLNSGNGGWYIGQLFNSNTTYSDMTQAEIDAGTGTTGRKITPKMLRDNFYTEDEVDGTLALKANTADLADVAFSGSYNDLEGTPTIPAAVTESTVSGWGFTKNTGTYSKPSNGIPKTDLADAVQTSLGKADTALQSFTENDPTVPSHVKGITTTDISNWNNKQAAIADLTDIRNGAALGATALQSYTETDPTVPAWAKATNKPSYTAAEVGALPDTTVVPSASTATPQMDGTGAAGSASTYAKGDHVHPSDTSREARVTTVSHGTNDTTFALTPNVLHTWGTVNSLTLSLVSGSSTYVDGYWFKFTAGSSFTSLTMPDGVNWVTEPEIEAGKTYEVMIVDSLASYVTDSIGDSVKAKTRIVNHGTSDTTYQLTPNEFHIWGEVASLTLTLKDESTGYVDGYWFRFTCGNTPTVLTLPSSIEWYYEEVEFEANHTYEVTIVEGKACYTDYASATHVATKQWVQNNVKTINGESIIGTGDIEIQGGSDGINIVAASGATLIAVVNTIYTYSTAVTNLAITLPVVADATKAEAVSFILTTGTSPNITFSSSNNTNILYHDGYSFEDSTMYELNAMFVGTAWIVGMCKITT